MNILKRYIKIADKRKEEYIYRLVNLYDYARLGELDLITDEKKYDFHEKAKEYRKEIIELMMKGLKK